MRMVAPSALLVLYGTLVLALPSCELCRAGGEGAGEDDLDKVIEELAKTIAESQVGTPCLLYIVSIGYAPAIDTIRYRKV